MQVHDELVLEAPELELERVKAIVPGSDVESGEARCAVAGRASVGTIYTVTTGHSTSQAATFCQETCSRA